MGFVYEEEKYPAKIKGKDYSLRAPTVLEQEDFDKELASKDKGAAEAYINLFEKLGLPRDVAGSMSQKGLIDLLGYVFGTKKN